MPSKSKSQQRFFGMVDAYKKGEMKNASSKIKKAANGMSMSDVKDFAETKHKGLPEKVEENIIRLTENDLHRMVMEAVKNILKEHESQDHIFSEKEMQWLYDNQDKLSPIQQKVLNAGMWVRARQANYHGYAKRWPNIILKNGETYYYESNGKLRKTGT
jgi:hypothetical protein